MCLITLKFISSYPGLLLVFSEKKAFSNSSSVRILSSCIRVFSVRYDLKSCPVSGILDARFGPTFMKYSLKCFAMSFWSEISVSFTINRLGRLLLISFVFPIISLITCHVFLYCFCIY